MRKRSASLGNFREEFHLINDTVQGVCNTRKFQKHCFWKYHTWFSGYVPSFRKNMRLIFPLFAFAFLQSGSIRSSVCLRKKHSEGCGRIFFNIWDWVFLMTLVDILRFLFQRRWNNIKCVCEDLQDVVLLLDVFTTWCLKFPMLISKALPPSSGQLNSVKWNLKWQKQYVLSKRRKI